VILGSRTFGLLATVPGIAQTPEGVVPITAEPEHKVRFDHGAETIEVLSLQNKGSTPIEWVEIEVF